MKSIIRSLLTSKIKLGLSLFVLGVVGFVLFNTGTVHAGGVNCNLVGGGVNGSSRGPAQLTVRFIDANGNPVTASIGYTLESADGYPDIANFDGNGNWTGFSSNSVGSRTCPNANFDVWWYPTCGGPGNSCDGTIRGNGWALLCTQHPDGNPGGGSTGWPSSFRVVGIEALPWYGGAGGGQAGQWLGFFGPSPGQAFGVANGYNTDITFIWSPTPPPPPPNTPDVTTFCDASNTSKANIFWSGSTGSIGGFWVDISTSSGFGSFSNKWVGTATSTVAPDGFSPGMSFSPGTTYYTRVWNGQISGTRSFVAQSCITAPSTPSFGQSCSGTTLTVTVNWNGTVYNVSGQGLGFWVDVATSSSFPAGYSSKFVSRPSGSTSHSTTIPSGLNPALSLNPGTRYYARIGNGTLHSPTNSFVAQNCVPPPVVTIGATPDPAEVGDPVTVSWDADSNATSCQSAGGVWGSGSNKPINSSGVGSEVRPASDTGSPGTITYTITCTGPGGTSTPVSKTINVGYKPYMRVYGGDVLAGTGFGSSCSTNNSAFIAAFGKSSGAGAASQFAVQAPSAITEFASAANSASLPSLKKLTFANSGGSTYGGNFNGGQTCIKDYFASKSDSAVVQSSGYQVNAQTISASTDPAVSKRAIYVDGNVRINGNVVFGNNGSWKVASIPSFYLIVRGNIYIQSSVTQLDGVYIAQPRDDNNDGNPDARTGYIYTCSNGLQSQYASEGSNHAGYYNACDDPLVVNGSFIANRVMFGRTRGTRNSASAPNESGSSTNIAEVFNYSPALWLVDPTILPSSGTTYDSAGSLPPVL